MREFGGLATSLAGARLSGHLNADYAESVELRFADGDIVRPDLTWVSEPIGARFFIYDIPPARREPGHAISGVVALDGDGDIVADERGVPPYLKAGCLSSVAVTPEARQYLQRRLDDVRNLRLMRLEARGDVIRSTIAHAGGALEALRGVGLVSDEEFAEWNARFWEAATGEPPPSPPEHMPPPSKGDGEDAAATSVAVAMAAPIGDAPPLPRPRFQEVGFRRLIPGPDEEKVFGPGRVRILALVVFDDGVDVEWLFSLARDQDLFATEREAVAKDLDALPAEEQARRLEDRDRHLRWHAAPRELGLSDDVGTAYQMQGGGAHGGFVTLRGHQGFAPTIPPEATEMYVDADHARFTVSVRMLPAQT
jgi:hypothetical protein